METIDLIKKVLADDAIICLCETREFKNNKFLYVGFRSINATGYVSMFYGCGFNVDMDKYSTQWNNYVAYEPTLMFVNLDKILVLEQITTLYRICNENNDVQEWNNSLKSD